MKVKVNAGRLATWFITRPGELVASVFGMYRLRRAPNGLADTRTRWRPYLLPQVPLHLPSMTHRPGPRRGNTPMLTPARGGGAPASAGLSERRRHYATL